MKGSFDKMINFVVSPDLCSFLLPSTKVWWDDINTLGDQNYNQIDSQVCSIERWEGGRKFFFLHDPWMEGEVLRQRFLRLYNIVNDKGVKVADICN